ncbi:MAG TPA: biotin/lipoyl-containing protein, partial [Solirubrobacteraceae bacterium]|nr:biotin/lipoyl-containing protein [Solirubrobacteraceae bacterium]
MADIVMPRLSDTMEEGTILRWLKADGEEVARGEELVEIETDKASMTYESDQAGVLQILAAVGDTLAVGRVIARVAAVGAGAENRAAGTTVGRVDEGPAQEGPAGAGVRGAQAPASGAQAPVAPSAPAHSARAAGAAPGARAPGAAPGAPAPDGDAHGERIRASPLARRLARESGIDLRGLTGSGPGGRIVKA